MSDKVQRKEKRDIKEKGYLFYIIFVILISLTYFFISIKYGSFLYFIYIPVLMIALCIGWLIVDSIFSKFKLRKALKIIVVIWKVLITIIIVLVLVKVGLNIQCDDNLKYINSLSYSDFEKKDNEITINEDCSFTIKMQNDNFRILQLSDLHLCSSITTVNSDKKSIDTVYETIKSTNPDLIIVTGDMAYATPFQTMKIDNYTPIYQFVSLMNNIDIPWTFTYGNHDTERICKYDADYLNSFFDENSIKNGYSLLFNVDMPKIDGRHNNYIKILNPDSSLNKLVFLLDSNDYVKFNEYDTIHENQIEWYCSTVNKLSNNTKKAESFLFFHIPLKEFETVYSLYESGSSEIKYLFGENQENVCCSNVENNIFDVIKQYNCKAIFVGHDHINNIGLNYEGIDMVYCKTCDYIAYPKIDKKTGIHGGTVIDLTIKNTYNISQYCYD